MCQARSSARCKCDVVPEPDPLHAQPHEAQQVHGYEHAVPHMRIQLWHEISEQLLRLSSTKFSAPNSDRACGFPCAIPVASCHPVLDESGRRGAASSRGDTMISLLNVVTAGTLPRPST